MLLLLQSMGRCAMDMEGKMLRRKGDMLTYIYDWLAGYFTQQAARRRQTGRDWTWR
jgi:hypothetical protein